MQSVSNDLFERAAPPCHECPRAVERVEQSWDWDQMEGGWRLRAFTVCSAGHRVLVERLPDISR